MKKLIIMTALFTTFFENQTFAALTADNYAKTDLWQAPVIQTIQLRFYPLEDYSKQCSALETILRSYVEFGSVIPTKTYKRLIQMPIEYSSDPYNTQHTYAQFKVEIDTETNNEGVAKFEVKARNFQKTSFLPYYNQQKSIQELSIGSIIINNDELPFVDYEEGKTLTSLSKFLGVVEGIEGMANAEINYSAQDGAILTVFRKDLACDLIAGRGFITTPKHSIVRLPKTESENLSGFYSELFLKMESLVKNSNSNERKTLSKDETYLLGVRVGSYVREHLRTQDENEIEKVTSELRKILFGSDFKTQIPLFNLGIRIPDIGEHNLTVNLIPKDRP